MIIEMFKNILIEEVTGRLTFHEDINWPGGHGWINLDSLNSATVTFKLASPLLNVSGLPIVFTDGGVFEFDGPEGIYRASFEMPSSPPAYSMAPKLTVYK